MFTFNKFDSQIIKNHSKFHSLSQTGWERSVVDKVKIPMLAVMKYVVGYW